MDVILHLITVSFPSHIEASALHHLLYLNHFFNVLVCKNMHSGINYSGNLRDGVAFCVWRTDIVLPCLCSPKSCHLWSLFQLANKGVVEPLSLLPNLTSGVKRRCYMPGGTIGWGNCPTPTKYCARFLWNRLGVILRMRLVVPHIHHVHICPLLHFPLSCGIFVCPHLFPVRPNMWLQNCWVLAAASIQGA